MPDQPDVFCFADGEHHKFGAFHFRQFLLRGGFGVAEIPVLLQASVSEILDNN
jgi:hypothetical protein